MGLPDITVHLFAIRRNPKRVPAAPRTMAIRPAILKKTDRLHPGESRASCHANIPAMPTIMPMVARRQPPRFLILGSPVSAAAPGRREFGQNSTAQSLDFREESDSRQQELSRKEWTRQPEDAASRAIRKQSIRGHLHQLPLRVDFQAAAVGSKHDRAVHVCAVYSHPVIGEFP